MNAQELRIGNYFLDNDSSVFKIEELRRFSDKSKNQNVGILYRKKSSWLDCEHAEPIPLTEEWLLKFGLCPNGCLFEFVSNFYIRHNDYGNGEISIEEYSEGSKELKHIKYVHQLQNLYFALTGEELTIKT